MRSPCLRIALVVFAILLLHVAPCLGQDYLIIKKKDGTTQRVPLKFNPDEIETFDVEAGPQQGAPPAEEPEGKPLQITPGVREPRPERAPARREAEPEPTRERPKILRDEPAPSPTRAPERAPAARGPVSGPPAPRQAGLLTVNVYKLPDNVRALPDYSAFRPEKVVTTDSVNLQPGRGDRDPAGLPENPDGMGLRIIGVFHVAGEGIFRWRINAKDGVRLHIDDKTLIENDGIHPAASKAGFVHLAEGTHSLVLDSFNSTGQPVLQLFVTPPMGQEEIFSDSKGLAGWKEPEKPYDVLWGQVYFVPKGNYPQGPDFSRISPIGRLIAPDLDISGAQGIPGLPGRSDMVGIRYEGFFNVEGAGVFAFRVKTDNFAKLTIGKHEIVSITDGLKSDPNGKLGWAFLQKGSYPISLDYFHREGDPRLQLYVTQPEHEEKLFAPAEPLVGYAAESGKMNMIPAFVYFLKPGTRKMPNFNKMQPSGMFFAKAIDFPANRGTREFPGIPKRENWFGIRFYVKFSLSEKEEGTYKFRIVADDSARLIVGNKLVVSVDSPGAVQEKTGSIVMNAGSHEMFLDYLQGDGPSAIQLYITAPDSEEKVFAFQ